MNLFVWRQGWILKVYLLLFLWFCQGRCTLLQGQTFAFQHITEKEGLPSAYLYGILQEEEGHIWISGESGVYWFDGQHYYRPEVQDELKDEIIKFFNIDSKRVWMQDLAGRLMYYEKGKIRQIEEVKPSAIYEYTEVYEDIDGGVWIASLEDVFICHPRSDDIIPLHVEGEKKFLEGKKAFGHVKDNRVILVGKYGYCLFDGEEYQSRPFKNGKLEGEIASGFNIKDKFYVIVNNKIYSVDIESDELIPEFEIFNPYFELEVLEAYVDSRGQLWFSTRDGLLLITIDNDGKPKITKHLQGEIMGNILEDNEGNLWFATAQNGVFKLASTAIQVYIDEGNSQIRFIKENAKGQLVLGFDNNQFSVLDESYQVIESQKLMVENHRLYDYVLDSIGNQYFITSNGFLLFDEQYHLLQKSEPWSLKSCAITSDGTMWMAAGDFFGFSKNGGQVMKLSRKRTYSVFPVSSEKVWVGTIEGLYKYENEKFTYIDNPALSHDIRDIQLMDDGLLLLATQKNGLYCYLPSLDSIVHHFSIKTGLSSNNCSKMLVDENFIWLGTKKGINRINRTDFSISMIGNDQGLPSNEVNFIHRRNDNIYVATNKGMAVFDKKISLKRRPPNLLITGIKIEEKDTTIHEYYQLDYDQNNIKIEFSSVTFNDASQAIYQYKMEGIDQDWVHSKVSIAQYPSLPSGDYNFRVKVKTVNSGWSAERSVRFYIETPFWRSTAFYIIIAFLGMGLFYLIFSEIDNRRSAARNLKASRLTALRAQMNPHFIFNALNSIQEFIINKDTRAANKYLTQFARLMRNTLNVSDKDRITLGKEIESLNFYLSLESLRFGESFEYILELDEAIDKDALYLPPMLIQPLVENSIKRGLMHKTGVKKLYLRFYLREKSLICEVEDNGVGRDRSAEIRKLNPKIFPSKATDLINERLKLFNSMDNNDLAIEVQDLKDHQGIPLGTKVIITINASFKGF